MVLYRDLFENNNSINRFCCWGKSQTNSTSIPSVYNYIIWISILFLSLIDIKLTFSIIIIDGQVWRTILRIWWIFRKSKTCKEFYDARLHSSQWNHFWCFFQWNVWYDTIIECGHHISEFSNLNTLKSFLFGLLFNSRIGHCRKISIVVSSYSEYLQFRPITIFLTFFLRYLFR